MDAEGIESDTGKGIAGKGGHVPFLFFHDTLFQQVYSLYFPEESSVSDLKE
jgi:hypothetical protein